MLKAIAAILVVLWLAGFLLHVAGSLIHLLLLIGILVFFVDLFSDRQSVL